jgi:hypothetical protein
MKYLRMNVLISLLRALALRWLRLVCSPEPGQRLALRVLSWLP